MLTVAKQSLVNCTPPSTGNMPRPGKITPRRLLQYRPRSPVEGSSASVDGGDTKSQAQPKNRHVERSRAEVPIAVSREIAASVGSGAGTCGFRDVSNRSS